MLAQQLVNQAYLLSQLTARQLEAVQGDQGNDGIFWLNQLFSEINQTGRYIPYYSYPEINTVIGQETYFVQYAVTLETVTFNIGPVRYQMNIDNRRHYFGAPRVDNILALPFNFYWERSLGGATLYVYFLPQQVYVLKLKGRFMLMDNVIPSTDLSSVYDDFYQLYLMFALADYLCIYNGISTPPNVTTKLLELKDAMEDVNPMDTTLYKRATASKTDSITYAQANIGQGWTTP